MEVMHKKSREMEALVSLIQRAWSQLDIDASLLLDSLGDTEVVVSDRGAGELLFRFLQAGRKHLSCDPTDDSFIPQLEGVDEYSSAEDIAKAQAAAMKSLQTETEEDNENDVDVADGAALEGHLHSHVTFTLNLLEKICNAITDSSLQIPTEAQQSIARTKESYSKILFLKDEIAKLRTEVFVLYLG